ncbi:MAG: IS5 family transposase [Deinococcus sp.]|nr:IS5 family transposase [Deinococcus sp.]
MKGTKDHVVVEGGGLPLGLAISGAEVHDQQVALATLDSIRVPRPHGGRPRRRPRGLAADKGYDGQAVRQGLRQRRIRASIPERRYAHRRKRGRKPLSDVVLSGGRWVVERSHAWFASFRRLRVRDEKTSVMHQAFQTVAAMFMCLRRLLSPLPVTS